MSKKELTRLEVIQRLEQKRMRQKEAAEILGVSTRHIRRLLQSYRGCQEKGLISKRRGKPSNNLSWPNILIRPVVGHRNRMDVHFRPAHGQPTR